MSDEELMRIAFADKRTVQDILRYIFELGEQKGRADAIQEILNWIFDDIESHTEKIGERVSKSYPSCEMILEYLEQLKGER